MDFLSHYYKNKFIRRLLLTFLLLIMSLLILLYSFIYLQAKNYQNQFTQNEFNTLVTNINVHLSENSIPNFNDILIKYPPNIDNYQLIIFMPTGKTIIKNEGRFAKIATNIPELHLNYENYTLTDTKKLIGWHQLNNGYQLYAELLHQPLYLGFNISWLWLPILCTVVFLALFVWYINREYAIWLTLAGYANSIFIRKTYQPLTVTHHDIIGYIENALNKISFKLIQQHKHNQQQQVKIQRLIDASPELLFLLNKEGELYYFNSKFESLFNVNRQIKTQNLTDLCTGIDKNAQQQLLRLHEIRNPVYIVVLTNSPKNYYDLWLEPLTNHLGQTIGFSGSLHNISRDQGLLAQQTIAQQELDERLAANERLWAIMGHELRTPLNGMIGMVELLEQTQLNAEQLDYVSTLSASSNNMLHLLNDMLDLAKLDAGKMHTNFYEVDIMALCREACDLMVANATQKNIELLFFADPHVPKNIMSDAVRLRQILLNLLGNAIKFTKTGYVALVVDIQKPLQTVIANHPIDTSDDKAWLNFRIIDTGVGIDENEQQHLFSFFNQANKDVSRKFGGTGLGLAISKNLAAMMGGFIHLSSLLGIGSEFSLYLPCKVPNQRSIYSLQPDLKNICVTIFTPSTISYDYFSQVFDKFNIWVNIQPDLSAQSLENIRNHCQSQWQPIVLIDHILLTDEKVDTLIAPADCLKNAPKILMSQLPERNISANILNQFDGYVGKPVYIDNLIIELSRLYYKIEHPQQDQQVSKVQQDFNAFMADLNNTVSQTDPTQLVAPEKKHLNILLAEDNLINQRVAKKMLEKLGCQVTIAENGIEAIEKLQSEQIDIVLMDCRMPKMDGLEATRQIRQQQNSTPIIALTANDTDDDREACLAAGMDAFLAKPISQDKLTQQLKRFSALSHLD